MVLINMEDCIKRCFSARLQFGGKERLRETKRGEASQRYFSTCFAILHSPKRYRFLPLFIQGYCN